VAAARARQLTRRHTLGAGLRSSDSIGVDWEARFSSDEARAGPAVRPNEFARADRKSRWHAFFRKYRDPLQLVLLAAGIGKHFTAKNSARAS